MTDTKPGKSEGSTAPYVARPQPRRAIVVGGSLCGLFAATLLHGAGWRVDIYERSSDDLSGRGAGIVTHPELFEVLRRAGVRIGAEIGVEVRSRVTFARNGDPIGEWPLRQILTAWGRLWRHLRAVFPPAHYHSGATLTGIEQDERGVSAHFADGTVEDGDLLVGADGIRSTVRRIFLPEVGPTYAGYVAWRGLVEEMALVEGVRRALFEHLAFCLPPREQILGYPVAGADDEVKPGRRRYNFVWYRPADEVLDLPGLLTDSSGRLHRDGIPPNMVSRHLLDALRADAARLLAPQFEEVVRLTAQPFIQPIYDLESPRMSFGRVILLGDAAFVARPHCGVGVTKAAGDALCLADTLRDGTRPIAAALAQVETVRSAFGRSMVAHARRLGAYMQAQIKAPEDRIMAERYRSPEAVMRETAIPLPEMEQRIRALLEP
ncbi:MAG TPA: FAD binding domain-containing protein [Alphaproteobacteria bacterium]|nr:FAD binding domain-containing protein [Alphaproteobacteria bacterium]